MAFQKDHTIKEEFQNYSLFFLETYTDDYNDIKPCMELMETFTSLEDARQKQLEIKNNYRFRTIIIPTY